MKTSLGDPRDWPIPPMDHGSGHKDTAFTWAMGELILARIMAGETVKAITADARMPAYCTVYRWMRVVPEFGEAVAELRAALADVRRASRDNARRARKARKARERAERGTRRPRGPSTRGTCSARALDALLSRVRSGASMSEAVAARGAPSAKALYWRLRTCPGFRVAFVDACDWRGGWLGFEAELEAEEVWTEGIPACNAKIAALKGRRGRLTPRVYRAPAPTAESVRSTGRGRPPGPAG